MNIGKEAEAAVTSETEITLINLVGETQGWERQGAEKRDQRRNSKYCCHNPSVDNDIPGVVSDIGTIPYLSCNLN
jgi:hypothetical protein